MDKEIIKNLDNDLLLELHKDTSSNLTYQRKYWLENEKSRTSHFESLILETRQDLNYIREQIKLRGLKYEN